MRPKLHIVKWQSGDLNKVYRLQSLSLILLTVTLISYLSHCNTRSPLFIVIPEALKIMPGKQKCSINATNFSRNFTVRIRLGTKS